MTDTRILLLGSAPNETLDKVLGKPGRAVTRIDDPDKLRAAVADHDVVVLDTVPAPRTVTDVTRELRANADLAELPILAITSRSIPTGSSRADRGSPEPGRPAFDGDPRP